MEDEINLTDILKVIIRYKNPIAGLFLISVLIAFILGMTSPILYKATTSILPLTSSSTSSFGDVFGLSSGGVSNKIIIVLQSKTLNRSVIEDLDLLKFIYKKKWDNIAKTWKGHFRPYMDDAIKAMSKKINIKSSKTDFDNIEFSIVWDNPEMAAKIANKYVEKLSDFINNRSLGVTFQIVDPATIPERPESRGVIKRMFLAGIISLLVGVIGALTFDGFRKMSLFKS